MSIPVAGTVNYSQVNVENPRNISMSLYTIDNLLSESSVTPTDDTHINNLNLANYTLLNKSVGFSSREIEIMGLTETDPPQNVIVAPVSSSIAMLNQSPTLKSIKLNQITF